MNLRNLLATGLVGLTLGCADEKTVAPLYEQIHVKPLSVSMIPSVHQTYTYFTFFGEWQGVAPIKCVANSKRNYNREVNDANALVQMEINDQDIGNGDEYLLVSGYFKDKNKRDVFVIKDITANGYKISL